jgi:hypothetical protein
MLRYLEGMWVWEANQYLKLHANFEIYLRLFYASFFPHSFVFSLFDSNPCTCLCGCFMAFSIQDILNIKNLNPNVDILVSARYDNNMSVEMMLQKDG